MAKDIKPVNPNTAAPAAGTEPKTDERKTSNFKWGRKSRLSSSTVRPTTSRFDVRIAGLARFPVRGAGPLP